MAVLSHGGGRENSQEFLITIILFSPPSNEMRKGGTGENAVAFSLGQFCGISPPAFSPSTWRKKPAEKMRGFRRISIFSPFRPICGKPRDASDAPLSSSFY